MNTSNHLNRRAFVAATVQSTAALALSSWSSAASAANTIRLPVSQARAIAINDAGLIAIAADRKILFCNLDGIHQRELNTERPVRALCHDVTGRLWMTVGDQVARLSDAGEVETVGDGLGRAAALTGIAVADDGRIFAADSAQRVIWRLDAAGKVLGQIKVGDHGFAVPRAFFPIAWQDGQLVVAEPGRHQIQRYMAGGEKISHWGQRSRDAAGFAGCCNPVSFATLADGSVITAERGQVRVKRFDAAGTFVTQLAGPDSFAKQEAKDEMGDLFGCAGGLLDVAASKNGRVVVLDRSACEIRVLA